MNTSTLQNLQCCTFFYLLLCKVPLLMTHISSDLLDVIRIKLHKTAFHHDLTHLVTITSSESYISSLARTHYQKLTNQQAETNIRAHPFKTLKKSPPYISYKHIVYSLSHTFPPHHTPQLSTSKYSHQL